MGTRKARHHLKVRSASTTQYSVISSNVTHN